MIAILFFPKFIKQHPWVAVGLAIIMFVISMTLIDLWRERSEARKSQ